MNDACARTPEANPITSRAASKEVVDLAVRRACGIQVLAGSMMGLDQMIAVHRRGHRRFVFAGLHELQQCHLSGRILHGHSIRSKE